MAREKIILKKAISKPISTGDMIQNPLFIDDPTFRSWERVGDIQHNSLDGLFCIQTTALEEGNSLANHVYIRTYNIYGEKDEELVSLWCDPHCYSNEVSFERREEYDCFMEFITAGLQEMRVMD